MKSFILLTSKEISCVHGTSGVEHGVSVKALLPTVVVPDDGWVSVCVVFWVGKKGGKLAEKKRGKVECFFFRMFVCFGVATRHASTNQNRNKEKERKRERERILKRLRRLPCYPDQSQPY